MNIRQRIILLVVCAFVALTGIGVFAVLQARSSAEQVKGVTEGVVPSASRSVALMGQLKDVQIATLSMVGAENAELVEKTRKALAERQSELTKALEDQLASADSPAQAGLVKMAQEGLAAYFASIEDTAKFKLAGQTELAMANMGATVDQYLREQGEMMTALQVEKNRSKDSAIADLNRRLERTKVTLGAITVVAVLALVTIGALLYRQIVLPIGEMERKMTEVATSQDFTQRLPVKRMDEVGRSVLAFNTMIEKIQLSAQLVAQKTADIHAMLHAIPQGILTIEAGGRIHPEYSEHLKVILETDELAGHDVMQAVFSATSLGADAFSQVDAAIGACIGEDVMNFEFNSHLLPTEIEKTLPGGAVKVLDLNWSPMADAQGTTTRLLLCVRDVTELRALARAAQAQKRELALIGEVLAVPQEKFRTFIDAAVGFVAQNESLLARSAQVDAAGQAEAVALLFRNMHTVKGNARTLGLLQLADVAHRIEDTYDGLRKGRQSWDQDRLVGELAEVRAAVQEHLRINDEKLGRRGPGRRGGVERFVMVPIEQVQRLAQALERADVHGGTALHEARATVRRFGTDRVEDTLVEVIDSLPSLAAELGKAAPVATIRDHGIVVRSQATGVLRNVFMHLMRNAVDHGIEVPAARELAGKPAAGHITVDVALDGEQLRLTLQDDGRGLALRRIRDTAVAAGLIGADEPLSPERTAALVFRSGFSTADRVTDVSGRGVGMDAARGFIEAEGGSLEVELLGDESAEGFRSFRTVVSLPAKFGVRLADSSAVVAGHA